MKKLRTFGAACVLALVFATAVRADDGYIHTDKAAPQPTPTPGAATVNADGYITIGFTSTDTVTEAALTLIQIVLTLP